MRLTRDCSVEALLRLHRKVKTTDTILDDPLRGDLNTTRVAWVEVRDNVARGDYCSPAYHKCCVILGQYRG